MDWILERLKEPSTWRGLATLLGSIGIAANPDLIIQIGVAVASAIAAIEIFRKEKSQG